MSGEGVVNQAKGPPPLPLLADAMVLLFCGCAWRRREAGGSNSLRVSSRSIDAILSQEPSQEGHPMPTHLVTIVRYAASLFITNNYVPTTQTANMKSWADHCSDSEDEDALHHPAAATAASPPSWHESSSEDEADQAAADEAPLPEPVPARTYTPADIPPGGPPFTAFVGNLPFSIKSPDDLVGEVRQLIGGDAGISRARLGKDRKTGKTGGFGYVEFDTADDLLVLLNLPNHRPPQIRGRDIKVDVAAQRQQPSGDRGDRGASFRGSSGRGSRTNLSGNLDDIDGSNFRGGRGSMGRNGSGRNDGGSNSNNNNSNRRNSNRQSSQRKDDGKSGGPPPVRQSLKLAPRTKPAEGAERSSSSSSIFGDAKPRDDAAWEAEREKRSSLAKAAEDSKKKEKKDGSSTGGDGGGSKKDKDNMRRSGSSTSVGKGGRGGGGAKRNNSTKSGGGKGGRGGGGGKGGRGGSMRKADSQKSAGGGKEEKKKSEPTIPKSAIVAPPAEKKKDDKKKVVNKFAALGFDSDSD